MGLLFLKLFLLVLRFTRAYTSSRQVSFGKGYDQSPFVLSKVKSYLQCHLHCQDPHASKVPAVKISDPHIRQLPTHNCITGTCLSSRNTPGSDNQAPATTSTTRSD